MPTISDIPNAQELGLQLTIPEGISVANVAQRKQALILAGACERDTLNGQLLAEKLALDAEVQQVLSDKHERAKEEALARKQAAGLQRIASLDTAAPSEASTPADA